ncbi:MAG: hypothetical protein AB7O66_03425 [Limisphaerales bacterium]
MPPSITSSPTGPIVLVAQNNGITVIPQGTPLARLNYFDGKFLRADDLNTEQRYLRSLVELSNQAGGHGVVHGYDVTEAGAGRLMIGPGLAIDPAGRVLLLPDALTLGLAELLEKSRGTNGASGSLNGVGSVAGSAVFGNCVPATDDAPVTVTEGGDLFLITLAHAEALCGEEDVYGRLCEQACITSTDRPFRIEGIVVRARPLSLIKPLPTSTAEPPGPIHLRSRVASAFFAGEPLGTGSLISKAGLESDVWCRGARIDSGTEVPIAVIGLAGGTLAFLDPWIARRERIDEPARRYWQWRMSMRPWNVFLAHVLQFQCQLRDSLGGGDGGGTGTDPCLEAHRMLGEAARHFETLKAYYRETTERLARASRTVRERIATDLATTPTDLNRASDFANRLVEVTQALKALPTDRLLIRRGIVELPSAGYLPVAPSSTLTVNEQVRRLMGEGVNLRFCVVRPDYVAHALEEAQHLERISLTEGLDHPDRKQDVDILVPNGAIRATEVVAQGTGYEMAVDLFSASVQLIALLARNRDAATTGLGNSANRFVAISQPGVSLALKGAARGETTSSGGTAFYYSGVAIADTTGRPPEFTLIEIVRNSALWIALESALDPFSLRRNESTRLDGELKLLLAGSAVQLDFRGDLVVDEISTSGTKTTIRSRIIGSLSVRAPDAAGTTAGSAAVPSLDIADAALLVRDTGGINGSAFEVTLRQPSILGSSKALVSLRTSRVWSDPTNARVDSALLLDGASQPSSPGFTLIELKSVPLFGAAQKVSADALRPGNPARESATTGINALGAVLKQPEFAEIAARKLFPPPAAVPSDLQILAREDWVLFHRRRERQCARVDEPPAQLLPRRYRVYAVPLRSEDALKAAQAAFQAGDSAAIDALNPRAVATVEFSAGLQTLETSPDDVRSAWAARNPARSTVVFAAIGSRGAALEDGSTLATARLTTLAQALPPAASVRGDAEFGLLPGVPETLTLSAGTHDGIIVVLTIPVATTCHEVFRCFVGSGTDLEGVLKSLGSVPPSEIPVVLARLQALRLGRVVFEEDSNLIIGEEPGPLAQAWGQSGGGIVQNVVVVSSRPVDVANPTAEEARRIQVRKSQSARIATQVGAAIPETAVIHQPPEEPGDLSPCPSVTLLVSLIVIN